MEGAEAGPGGSLKPQEGGGLRALVALAAEAARTLQVRRVGACAEWARLVAVRCGAREGEGAGIGTHRQGAVWGSALVSDGLGRRYSSLF